ncbi:long-chain-fatty-acid--CoA ligase [Pyrobaculum aerophilum]|uniref:Long-chain fatty acid--CoA ligase n=1 Tax=Pyrobaculum aerophilum TaxID=13773 RepID=A0A371QYH8_9CREN|nr:long-chain fatty acid--CoA ligase [Pyrobaculum aerophilum]RFA95751.1 long-chain fatty acid--CoA ligase [Pyrobaculum aerophilum]RFA99077.1 long-chain fatty acid--CoA ligase [Pyrobaculum aerophilum]
MSVQIFEKYIKNRLWTKNYDEGVPPEVEIRPSPLFSYLDRQAGENAGRTAYIYFGNKIPYKTVGEHSDRIAAALREWGIGKGDVVALYMPNTPAFPVIYYGALKLGAVVTPMNPLYTPREVAWQAKDANARVIFVADVLYKNIEEAAKMYQFDRIVVVELVEYMPALIKPLAKRRIKPPKVAYSGRVIPYKSLLSYSPTSYRASINPSEDLAALMYTGGTTGLPKGAEITHGNISANLQQLKPLYDAVRKKRGLDSLVMMGLLPWYHIYGQVTVMHYGIFDGATVVVMPRPDIEQLMKWVQKYNVQVLHGVPTLYNMIINHPRAGQFNLKSLAFCISGAAPLPVEVARKFEQLTGALLREGYGLTETAVVTHVNPLYGKVKPGSIGLPIPSTYAAIADPEKPELLPPNQVGEIVISGPQVFKGYHNRPEENAQAFFECCGLRWFRTGDMGYMDEEGYFYVVERKKDLIKYKGYSVFSREIEEVLYQHPCVKEAAVIGVPHPEAGEIPKAFIVLRDECKGKVRPEDIIKWTEDKLAHYKRPRAVEFREELPKSAVGKILKRELKAEELRKLQEAAQKT